MSVYLKELNPAQQLAATQIEGPMMVIAGPGSGKTRVITYRIAHLLNTGILPSNILALTFTNKAARSMQERIETLVGDTYTKNLWMGTFHSVFSKLLRKESDKINYPTNFTIYDTDDAKSVVNSIIKEMGLDKDYYKTSVIYQRISSLKNSFISPNEYANSPNLVQSDKIAKRDAFGIIYQRYLTKCFQSGAMDFDDLLLNTYRLIHENADVLSKYQNKFQYILVDEYQDTNHVQYLIVNKLAAMHRNICVVGDDAQSIYSFRGADIQNILNFKKDYPDFKTFKLEQNYRSTSNIVNLANSLITHNKKQLEKQVWTHNTSGEKIIICETSGDNEEGRLVATTIREIYNQEESRFSDFAILYRTNSQSRALEESLRKNNIPYKIYGGLSFYSRKEIKDVLAYCRLAINYKDDEALKRIINYPSRGIGETTLQKLIAAANEKNLSIWEVITNLKHFSLTLSRGTEEKLLEFAALIQSFTNQLDDTDAYTLVDSIVKKTGIYHELSKAKEPEEVSKFENVQALLSGLKEFDLHAEKDQNTLSYFMQDVALLTDADNEKKEDRNKVTLMTIHAAKGLEFPYIFVVGMEENLFPSAMALENQDGLEEERRLFYVAITRAEKRLFLSFARLRFRWGQTVDCKPSRFLEEIDNKIVERKSLSLSYQKPAPAAYKIIPKNYQRNTTPITPPSHLKKIQPSAVAPIFPSNLNDLQVGVIVKHEKFGKGKILQIEGTGIQKKAVVFFEGIGQKVLLLQYAKLEILR